MGFGLGFGSGLGFGLGFGSGFGGTGVSVAVLVSVTAVAFWFSTVKVSVFFLSCSPPTVKTGSPQVYPSPFKEALAGSSLSVIVVPAGKVPG